jgi:HWE histidine kinase/PAS domain
LRCKIILDELELEIKWSDAGDKEKVAATNSLRDRCCRSWSFRGVDDLAWLMAHGDDAEVLTRIKAEFEGSSSSGTEVRYCRKDGGEFWTAVFISPVRNEGGDIVQYFASFVDLTKHKEDEAQSKMLIDELNHRVKNTLSAVQSIVWQTLRTPSDPKVIRQSIESRLFALSRSHGLLTREKWEVQDCSISFTMPWSHSCGLSAANCALQHKIFRAYSRHGTSLARQTFG